MRLLMLLLLPLMGLQGLTDDRVDDPAFVWAIIQKESSCRRSAVGDIDIPGGPAIGLFQVRQCALTDVNDAFGFGYTLKEMVDDTKAYRVFRAYIQLWATDSRLGHAPTHEDMARIWNGGPNGWKRKATSPYWGDVRRLMEKNRQARR